MKLKRLFLPVIPVLIFSVASAFGQVQPAKVIPEFTFQTSDSRPFSKKDLVKNKKIVFILFDVTCEHCQHEVQAIGKRYDDFKHTDIYLVSMDTWPSIFKFMGNYGKALNGKPNITLLHDFKPEFIEKFMPDKYPAIFVYSEKGQLIHYLSGQKDVNDIVKAVK